MQDARSDQRSDTNKASRCMVALVLAASLIGHGCAGVISGVNSSGKTGNPPPGTPPPTNTPQPQLSATPTSASFPGTAMGATGSQTVTLQNTGTGTVTISNVTVSGSGFSTSGLALPTDIAPGQYSTFNVVFSPSAAGNATGSVSITSNAPNSPLVISASGSAVASTPLLISSVSTLDFGSVIAGSSSSLSVILTNAGNGNLTISSVGVTGAGFSASGVGANTTLAPGQTAALNVTFLAPPTGSAVGTITIASSANAVSIALAGSAGQLSSHTVGLSWDASTSDVVGYFVYRMRSDGTYGKITSAPVVLTDYTDTNIQSGQTYTYVVTAVDADNVESDYSDPVLATIP